MEKTINPPIRLSELKKGDFFTIRPHDNPTDKQVYIKGDYDRSEKKYDCGRCDDISYSRYFRGSMPVYTNFIF